MRWEELVRGVVFPRQLNSGGRGWSVNDVAAIECQGLELVSTRDSPTCPCASLYLPPSTVPPSATDTRVLPTDSLSCLSSLSPSLSLHTPTLATPPSPHVSSPRIARRISSCSPRPICIWAAAIVLVEVRSSNSSSSHHKAPLAKLPCSSNIPDIQWADCSLKRQASLSSSRSSSNMAPFSNSLRRRQATNSHNRLAFSSSNSSRSSNSSSYHRSICSRPASNSLNRPDSSRRSQCVHKRRG